MNRKCRTKVHFHIAKNNPFDIKRHLYLAQRLFLSAIHTFNSIFVIRSNQKNILTHDSMQFYSVICCFTSFGACAQLGIMWNECWKSWELKKNKRYSIAIVNLFRFISHTFLPYLFSNKIENAEARDITKTIDVYIRMGQRLGRLDAPCWITTIDKFSSQIQSKLYLGV